MLAALAGALVIAAVVGTVVEMRHDGLRRRPFDPNYNSRVPN